MDMNTYNYSNKTMFYALYFLKIFSWPYHMACGVLVLQPGIEPAPLYWRHGVLTTIDHQGSLYAFLNFSASFTCWKCFKKKAVDLN